MKPFLYQVASLFYEKWEAEVSRLAFVFPNRRTGLFFQKYLSEVADTPLFSPTILTINDLFIQLSGKQSADRISMLFILYDIYIRQSGSTETFDEFLYWGEMLLNDFDDIDKYMANARMLFSNVTDLREIENDFDFLSDEQIAAIRSFWSSFYPRGDTPNSNSSWRFGKCYTISMRNSVRPWPPREKATRHDLPGGSWKVWNGVSLRIYLTSKLSSSV